MDDAPIKKSLDENGFAVLDFFSPEETGEYLGYFAARAADLSLQNGIHITMANSGASLKKRINDFLLERSRERITEKLGNCRVFGAGFIIKAKNTPESKVYPHQDWSFTDERRNGRSFTLWVALTDSTEEMGTIGVVPKSHLWSDILRFTPNEVYHNGENNWFNVNDADFEYLPLKAGQAVLWDHRLIHQSMPNRSAVDRVHVSFAILPENETLKLFWKSPFDGDILEFDVDDDFYNRHAPADFYTYYLEKRTPEGMLPVARHRRATERV